jgi:hypothetical protein
MGPGCESVTRIKTRDTDLVSGIWEQGRVGTYRGIRKNNADSGAIVFGASSIAMADKAGSYTDLCKAIGGFFRTLEPPVSPETTLEMFAFMEAADESFRRGGQPVLLAEVMAKSQTASQARLKEILGGQPQ